MEEPSSREAVAAEVRAAMARQQMTQVALAGKVDMSRVALADRLSARRPFAVDELYRIADALNVSVWSLVPAVAVSDGAA
ncbi:hypothetical protein GCM10011584_29270 [Nocardioides phosphati]|uniref:HTH cro/C1-type domain-containing protein n=1 Tax=Nocardioides phosphati TaxID=1867775 RepID=A0ABQ2NF26_9ACTN|nr:helix-turn-helix transcriptional regulator [Nocardioides phosphati]GGO92575.1 hypothetical protein GCM10011584_29270 [Nocardioides phosphati]